VHQVFFSFFFVSPPQLTDFSKKLAKLVEFTLLKKKKPSIFLLRKWQRFLAKNHCTGVQSSYMHHGIDLWWVKSFTYEFKSFKKEGKYMYEWMNVCMYVHWEKKEKNPNCFSPIGSLIKSKSNIRLLKSHVSNYFSDLMFQISYIIIYMVFFGQGKMRRFCLLGCFQFCCVENIKQ